MARQHAPRAPRPQPEGVPRFGSRWLRIALLLFLIYLVAFADRTNISVAAPAIATTFGLSATITGVLLSAFFWGYIVTMVPGGWLAQRVGPKRVITVASAALGLTTMAVRKRLSAAAAHARFYNHDAADLTDWLKDLEMMPPGIREGRAWAAGTGGVPTDRVAYALSGAAIKRG
jgi:MFS family permease